MSGTDLTSFSAMNLSDFQARERMQIQARLKENSWQRHAAIYAVFFLFIVISLIVMIFIYGNIQQDGLVLSIHKNTVNTTARRHKHNSSYTIKDPIVQRLPPTNLKPINNEHKTNITEKWTVQDTGVVKEQVLLNTENVQNEQNKINSKNNIIKGTKLKFPSLSTISTSTTIHHQKKYSLDSSIKLKITESYKEKTVFTTPTTSEKSPKLQSQLSLTTSFTPGYTNTNIYHQFPTFGTKVTFYGENYTEAPPDTTPTTTENIEKLERDLFAALDELAKKYK